MPQEFKKQYKKILRQYTLSQTEHNLYEGQNVSRELIQKSISPEEVISIHKASLEEIMPGLPEEVSHSFDFLIEVMIRYGLALKEHQTLIEKQQNFKMEMELATNVQQTLLKSKMPHVNNLDIGLISVPLWYIIMYVIVCIFTNWWFALIFLVVALAMFLPFFHWKKSFIKWASMCRFHRYETSHNSLFVRVKELRSVLRSAVD